MPLTPEQSKVYEQILNAIRDVEKLMYKANALNRRVNFLKRWVHKTIEGVKFTIDDIAIGMERIPPKWVFEDEK